MGKGTFVPTEAPALVPSTDWHGDLQLLATLVLGDHALFWSPGHQAHICMCTGHLYI